MSEYIRRSDALALARGYYSQGLKEEAVPIKAIKNIPSADVAEVQYGEWIPVTDRLPENDKTVLVWSHRNSKEYFNVYDHGKWVIMETEDITHWMPLPEPPKEETDG